MGQGSYGAAKPDTAGKITSYQIGILAASVSRQGHALIDCAVHSPYHSSELLLILSTMFAISNSSSNLGRAGKRLVRGQLQRPLGPRYGPRSE